MRIFQQRNLAEIKAEKEGASSGYLGLIQELQQQNEQLVQANAELKEEINLTQEALNIILMQLGGE